MSGRDDIQRVLDSTDLVRLIGEFVRLKPAGREFKGLCPFHDDTTPSMCVVPAKRIFHCFSCGTGGDAFRFVQLHLNLEFREALEYLAQRAGIELTPYRRPGSSTGEAQQNTDRISTRDIIAAHEFARDFYRRSLQSSPHAQAARRMLEERGIGAEMIEQFEIGAAPGDSNNWDALLRTIESANKSTAPFEKVGLLSPRRDRSGFVDRFRGRLIFPIHDEMGRPIAFGARKINPEDEPKYLNSPEHPRFHKSRTLYGMHLARNAMRSAGFAIVVEGYTDVIACHQAGITNVVATLGTALTPDHARALRHLCERVILLFDGDQAGHKAADRAIEVFFNSEIDVSIAMLEDGTDPAELLTTDAGRNIFEAQLVRAQDVVEYLLETCRRKWMDAESSGISTRQRTMTEFLERLGALGFHRMNPLRRDLVLARLVQLTGMDRATLLRTIPRQVPKHERSTTQPDEQVSLIEQRIAPARLAAERRLIACLVHTPDIADAGRRRLQSDQFADPVARQLFDSFWNCWDESRADAQSIAAQMLRVDEHHVLAGWLAQLSRDTGDDAQAVVEQFEAHITALGEYLAVQTYDYHRNGQSGGKSREGAIADISDVQKRIEQLRALGGNRRRYAASRAMPAPINTTNGDEQSLN